MSRLAFVETLGIGIPFRQEKPQETPQPANDVQSLRVSHRFVRTGIDDDGTWEARLAQRYDMRLTKDYVICDLKGYKSGRIGLRWRTESEVDKGKGRVLCGNKRCHISEGLQSYETKFIYEETGIGKLSLVKARLCDECAYKFHYKRTKAARKRQKRTHENG